MKINFSSTEKELLTSKLQKYFEQELDQELAQFDGEFLLDFITENMGVYFYNKGLQDAQAILACKVDDIAETIAANEITTELT